MPCQNQTISIKTLYSALFPRHHGERIIMVMRGYIDESYDSHIFTLSCLMATPHDWMWIESAWKKVLRNKNKELKKAGRQQISRYHATHCNGRSHEFEGWSQEEQIAFVKELLSVFRRFMTNSVAYSIPIADFVTVFPEHKAKPLPQMYGFLVKFLMTEINVQIAEIGVGYRVKPVNIALFHDRSSFDAIILDAFNQMMADPTFTGKKMFSSVTSTGWETCIPLQLADLMAYELFKDVSGKIAGRKRRKTLESMLSNDLFGGRAQIFDRKSLTSLRNKMEGK
jgi:hypothetical protein